MEFMPGIDLSAIQRQLKRYASRFLHKNEDIEDLVQETLTKVFESTGIRDIANARTYAFRTAHNLALNVVTRTSHQLTDYLEELLDVSMHDDGMTVEAHAIIREDFERLCEIIAKLPEQCRTVLILRKVYGLSQAEVAARLGIAVSTVEKHMASAIARCIAAQDATELAQTSTSIRLQRHDKKRR